MTEEQVERVARALALGMVEQVRLSLVHNCTAEGAQGIISLAADRDAIFSLSHAAITAMQPLFMAEAGDVGEPVKITTVEANALQALRDENERLRTALRPFAEEAGRFGRGNGELKVELCAASQKAIPNFDLSVAHFEAARAALAQEPRQ